MGEHYIALRSSERERERDLSIYPSTVESEVTRFKQLTSPSPRLHLERQHEAFLCPKTSICLYLSCCLCLVHIHLSPFLYFCYGFGFSLAYPVRLSCPCLYLSVSLCNDASKQRYSSQQRDAQRLHASWVCLVSSLSSDLSLLRRGLSDEGLLLVLLLSDSRRPRSLDAISGSLRIPYQRAFSRGS